MPEPFEGDPPEVRKRNSCKAVVVRSGKVLMTVNEDDLGDFYLLPGGGQKFGETLAEALVREVLEETGWLVEPQDLILSRDYLGANHEFSKLEADVHQTEMIFMARPLRLLCEPQVQDPWQTGVRWVSLDELKEIRLYPSILREILPEIVNGTYSGPLYLGDVN